MRSRRTGCNGGVGGPGEQRSRQHRSRVATTTAADHGQAYDYRVRRCRDELLGGSLNGEMPSDAAGRLRTRTAEDQRRS
ncbi:hypothetical protein C486_14002 [Natrinema gari JCM 14663]|uniref:Uncharacterized protein n=1 Tax=Natrinema gari JCM 14663 TaxID=1230459 RepID=L9YUY2_9EURY|nr:hypothetical protein C486_14002 [Natrinema gari JCM 14663]